MLIQVVILAILISALYVTWRRVRQRVVTIREAIAWSVLWIGAGIGVALPWTTTRIANLFGVGRGADFVVYGSVILLFVLLFKVFIAIDKLERKLTDLVRYEALKDLPEQKDKS